MDEGIPQLETPRLVLRGWRASDIDPYAAMCADPEVMRYVGVPIDRQQSWREMATHAGHWAFRGYGNWAVVRRDDGAVLGRAGLWNPEGWPGLEVGWQLARHAWGNGYATEAGRAAMDWAWEVLGATQLISLIHTENARSMRVAERLGMRPVRDGSMAGTAVVVYGIDRPG